MVKDTLNSMLDNIKERTTNPFLGTLLVVWIIRNWTLVYGLFNFDKGFTLDKKLKYIADHYQSQAFVPNLLIVVAITFLVLVSTYCMLTLGRLITDTYDKFVLPYLAKITDKSSIVLKTEYKTLEEVVKQLEVRLEEERLAKVAIQNDRERLEQRLAEALKPVDDNEANSNSTDSKVTTLMHRIVNRFIEEERTNTVNDIITNIQMQNSVLSDEEVVKKLMINDFIKYQRTDSRNSKYAYYTLTSSGKEFLQYWNETISNDQNS